MNQHQTPTAAYQPPDLSPGPEAQPPPVPATAEQKNQLIELIKSPAFNRRQKVKVLLRLGRNSFTTAEAADLLTRGQLLVAAWTADPATYWQAQYEKNGTRPDAGSDHQTPHLAPGQQWTPKEKS